MGLPVDAPAPAALCVPRTPEDKPSPKPLSIPSSPPVVLASSRPKKFTKIRHKRRPANMDKAQLFCHECGSRNTPEWRKGPAGPATLCNACGLKLAKKLRAEGESSNIVLQTL
eukprot:m51a1_g14049 putative gata-binding transcription factor (113) ;mRNA; r:1193323-1193990